MNIIIAYRKYLQVIASVLIIILIINNIMMIADATETPPPITNLGSTELPRVIYVYQDRGIIIAENYLPFRSSYQSTSASQVIQWAMDQLDEHGGRLIIGAGTFVIDRTIKIGTNISLEGMGRSTVLAAANWLNDDILQNKDILTASNHNISISNLTFNGNKDFQTHGSAIVFRSVTDSIITNVVALDCYLFGIFLSRGDKEDAFIEQSNRCVVSNCYVYNTGWDGIAITADNIIVQNCTTEMCGVRTNKKAGGITFEDARDCVAINCSSVNWTNYGIIVLNSQRILISKCIIFAGQLTVDTLYRSAVMVEEGTAGIECANITIQECWINCFSNPRSVGIYAYWTLENLLIQKNKITNCEESAIIVSMGVVNTRILDNDIHDESTEVVQRYCMELLNGVMSVNFSHNYYGDSWCIMPFLVLDSVGLECFDNNGGRREEIFSRFDV